MLHYESHDILVIFFLQIKIYKNWKSIDFGFESQKYAIFYFQINNLFYQLKPSHSHVRLKLSLVILLIFMKNKMKNYYKEGMNDWHICRRAQNIACYSQITISLLEAMLIGVNAEFLIVQAWTVIKMQFMCLVNIDQFLIYF